MKISDTNSRTVIALYTAQEVRDILFKNVMEKVGVTAIRPSEFENVQHVTLEDGGAEITVRLKVKTEVK